MKNIKKIIFFLTQNSIVCFMLLLFILILILGTIYQKEYNIISCQEKFFSSNFVYFLKYIPIPGGKLIFLMIFIIMLLKLITIKWSFNKAGFIIIHLSIILLITGSGLTFFFSKEGIITLEKNKDNKFFKIPNEYSIKINDKNNCYEFKLSEKQNKNLKILNIRKNTDFKIKKKFSDINSGDNITRFFFDKEIPMFLEDDRNNFTFFFENNNKIFCMFLDDKLMLNNFKFELKDFYEELPFSLSLIDFKKQYYNNSKNIKAYESLILVNDNNIKWIHKIKMNKPLKYKNFTFYQTSYAEQDNNIVSVLTVSQNKGEYFPYISCFLLILGFIIHILKSIFSRKEVFKLL